MVNRNLIRSLEDDDMLNDLAVMAPEEETEDWLLDFLQHAEQQDYSQGEIVNGRIVEINDEWALMDVGFKSEGTVNLNEWGPDEAKPKVGDIVKVLIEEMEDNYGAADDPYGMIALSKSKAEKIIEWEEIIKKIGEGQVVTGTVIRKIKGGLLVNIGVNVFLPGSQVDIRRPGDIGDFIGRVIQAEVLKIDDTRRNIVISRRSLIENQREEDRAYLMQELEVGQVRKGIVKNIADFGAFVDLGGIDGLLHITDMAWERISHPTEMVSIDQEIEVKVLHIDREKQKIALGLKQKDRNPWENIEEKYPVDSNHAGEVVNVMSYGAFVKLEPGIEGLVHISEMSWTKRVNHPSELVNIGDKIEVKILGVDPEGQQLSLGMKQTQKNPWDDVLERYPEGTDVTGKVRNLTNYGAFIELEEGIDGLLHVSDMSWTRKIGHPSELLEKGQELHCRVLSVDEQRRRIALGLKQLDNDPWDGDIPDKYQPGQLVKGNVTKITNFGVFIGLEDGLEGLLHISELAEHKVENPEEVVKVGDEIEVKVLRVDTDERKIGLSLKRVDWGEEEERAAAEAEAAESGGMPPQEGDLKGGLGSGEGPLFPTGG
ncbi:MAG: 30S ribosomal protein S1 [Planctomycetales bacterium]|nr:30S ribosomal protein S1 [Planctomycetales bacterium]